LKNSKGKEAESSRFAVCSDSQYLIALIPIHCFTGFEHFFEHGSNW